MKTLSTILVLSTATPALAGNGDHMAHLSSAKDGLALDSWNGGRPDGHAPIGVMADHTHSAGEFMVSYRYAFMRMEQNYDGTSRIGDKEFAGPPPAPFRVSPTDMDMEMHMFGLMYAPTDRLTLMGMFNLVELSMNHINRANGVRFRTDSSGLGDSSISGMYRLWDGHRQRAHLGLGILLPTAEVDEEDSIPLPGMGPTKTRLPYPMQLGSGSWGLAPSVTYLGQNDLWSWGGQLGGQFFLDDNDEGYRLGNRGHATVWLARVLNEWTSISSRLQGATWGNIRGKDDDLLPLPVPTTDPDRRGGSRLDASLGLNFQLPVKGARLALEAGKPLWHDVDGPQLVADWWTIAGFQWAW